MRYASLLHEGRPGWGMVDGDRIYPAPRDGSVPQTLLDFIRSGASHPDFSAWEGIPLDDTALQAPIPDPVRNIICLGLNYAEHAAESQSITLDNGDTPDHPVVFTKATTTINAPYGDFVLDARVTDKLDWEVELAVVMARGGRFIKADSALDHVFGYTVLNDLSARDLQRLHKQFFLGKSVDGSCPVGPWIVSADAIADPHDLELSCSVNGVVKQASNTRCLIFRIPEIVERLSTIMTLLPGDIIATGTPGGVGFARTPPEYLAAGDVVECRIDGIGHLRNRIIAA